MIKQHLSKKELIWMTVVFWAATFTAIEAPFSFVFKTKIQLWQVIVDIVISLLFIIDFIYHLKIIKESKKNRKAESFTKKLSRRLMMGVDIVSCIPFELLFFLGFHNEYAVLFRLVRMIRIIKIFFLIETIAILPRTFKIQSIVLGFLMVVNWIACGWIIIYPMTPDTDTTTYYIKSFYWALTTLTTIGYGDIIPTNNTGRVFTCFIMIIGVGMYGIIIGNISRMLASSDKHKEQTREKFQDLLLFMKHYKIPNELQETAIAHYSHLFSKRLSDNDEKIISDLPHALQQEMQLYMKIKLITNLPIFRNCSHECLKDVSKRLEQIYSSPGDMIINIGDHGDEMYIISHGAVDIILESGETVATLLDGQFFGEIALIKDITRTANVQSQNYCDLYKLTKKSFDEIIGLYPVLLSNIEFNTKKRTTDPRPKVS